MVLTKTESENQRVDKFVNYVHLGRLKWHLYSEIKALFKFDGEGVNM